MTCGRSEGGWKADAHDTALIFISIFISISIYIYICAWSLTSRLEMWTKM